MSGRREECSLRQCALWRALLAVVFVSTTAFLGGCGGSDPGRGTQNLHVEAIAFSGGTKDSTYIRVQVRQDDSRGQIQAGADVWIRGRDEGEWKLDWVGIDWGPFTGGYHYVDGIDWQRGWHLEVEHGEERRLEAYLEVPGQTRITSPIANTSYRPDTGVPLELRWEDSFGRRAMNVDVELNRNDYDVRLDGDPRSHEIPSSKFGRDGSERVTLERYNEIDLAGGARGSFFIGTTRHRVDFTVE